MSATPDHYAALGVSPTSDDEVIRAAFKAMMLKYHPDTNKSAGATAKAASINAAFSILGDPTKRAAYDQVRSSKASRSRTSPPDSAASEPAKSPPETGTSEASSKNSDIGGIFVLLSAAALGVLALASTDKTSTPVLTSNVTITDMGNETDMISDNMTAPDFSAPANTTAMANTNIFGELPAGPPPQTPLAFDDIEGAAQDFDRILQRRGILGARAFSTECHKAVAAQPSWSAADRCAAFDYAAAFVDDAVSQSAGVAKNSYFAFQRDNQSDYYNFASWQSYAVSQRLLAIRRAAEPAIEEEIRARIASTSRKSLPAEDTSRAAGEPLN